MITVDEAIVPDDAKLTEEVLVTTQFRSTWSLEQVLLDDSTIYDGKLTKIQLPLVNPFSNPTTTVYLVISLTKTESAVRDGPVNVPVLALKVKLLDYIG